MLTDTKLRNLKPTGKLYKVGDRDASFLHNGIHESPYGFLGLEVVSGIVGFEILHTHGNIILPIWCQQRRRSERAPG